MADELVRAVCDDRVDDVVSLLKSGVDPNCWISLVLFGLRGCSSCWWWR